MVSLAVPAERNPLQFNSVHPVNSVKISSIAESESMKTNETNSTEAHQLKLSGFADEAGAAMEDQIEATCRLGWKWLDLRKVNRKPFYELPMDEVRRLGDLLAGGGLQVASVGSSVADWSRSVDEPMDKDLAEMEALLPRIELLGIPAVRVMSYKPLGGDPFAADQMLEERVRRLRIIQQTFSHILVLHENCMNYGGLGWHYTLQLVEQVPGLRLVFDTGNPVISPDVASGDRSSRQSSWEFYQRVLPHITAVHIKDPRPKEEKPGGAFHAAKYVFPGEGEGDVSRIIADLLARRFSGVVSIEPHLPRPSANEETSFEEAHIRQYVEYGRRLEALIAAAP